MNLPAVLALVAITLLSGYVILRGSPVTLHPEKAESVHRVAEAVFATALVALILVMAGVA
jgi:hypothetical protein